MTCRYLVNNYDCSILLKVYDILVENEKNVRESGTQEEFLEYEKIVSDFTFLLKRMNLLGVT